MVVADRDPKIHRRRGALGRVKAGEPIFLGMAWDADIKQMGRP
jgi:hypothetical protein